MKAKRLQMIIELVNRYAITTQDELQQHLKTAGFNVTQATISRDIRELRLVKVVDRDQNLRYAVSGVDDANETRFETIFRESVISVAAARNILVIKSYIGMANAACAAFDANHFPHVVGTLAGDDTVLVIMDEDEHAAQLLLDLNEKLGY